MTTKWPEMVIFGGDAPPQNSCPEELQNLGFWTLHSYDHMTIDIDLKNENLDSFLRPRVVFIF